jgi:hypothetical protein
MVLPSTGNSISFNQIRIELGVPSQTLFNLESASNDAYGFIQNCQSPYPTPSNPDGIDEWWSYDHSKTGSAYLLDADYSATSCADACTNTPFISCFNNIYSFNSTYYLGQYCRAGTVTGYYVHPASCPGGSKVGQTCYQMNNGTLVGTSTCTTTTTTTTTTTEAPTCVCGPGNICSAECPNQGADCSGDPNICFI